MTVDCGALPVMSAATTPVAPMTSATTAIAAAQRRRPPRRRAGAVATGTAGAQATPGSSGCGVG